MVIKNVRVVKLTDKDTCGECGNRRRGDCMYRRLTDPACIEYRPVPDPPDYSEDREE